MTRSSQPMRRGGPRWWPVLLLAYVLLVLAAIALSLVAWAWTGGGVELVSLAAGRPLG